ncbi:MAG: Holliday junction branch migration protein RuvA, partial [Deltaproteobacteria bacterium]|nr:Holliday junction branch migration protein RuvA [Deltaproteobacteria bacterium]
MIARLTGTLALKTTSQLIIDVGGVGYQVLAPLSTFYQLPETGHKVELIVHTHVSDSAIQLYGFLTDNEKSLFTLLLGVSGIGPKLALNVLSGIEAPDLVRALASGDHPRIQAVPGVGKKTAQRMVVELKEKAALLGWAGPDLEEPLPEGERKTAA